MFCILQTTPPYPHMGTWQKWILFSSRIMQSSNVTNTWEYWSAVSATPYAQSAICYGVRPFFVLLLVGCVERGEASAVHGRDIPPHTVVIDVNRTSSEWHKLLLPDIADSFLYTNGKTPTKINLRFNNDRYICGWHDIGSRHQWKRKRKN